MQQRVGGRRPPTKAAVAWWRYVKRCVLQDWREKHGKIDIVEVTRRARLQEEYYQLLTQIHQDDYRRRLSVAAGSPAPPPPSSSAGGGGGGGASSSSEDAAYAAGRVRRESMSGGGASGGGSRRMSGGFRRRSSATASAAQQIRLAELASQLEFSEIYRLHRRVKDHRGVRASLRVYQGRPPIVKPRQAASFLLLCPRRPPLPM